MHKNRKLPTFLSIFILGALLITIAISTLVIINKDATNSLLSLAGKFKTQEENLGLNVSVESVTPETATVRAAWNAAPLQDPNFAFFTAVIRKQKDNALQSDEDEPVVGMSTEKVFTIPLCPGDHKVVVRAFYRDGTVKYQQKDFSYQSPLTAEGQILTGNPSFESVINKKKKPNDLDPDCWVTAEGRMTPGTGNEEVEKPSMIRVISSQNGISPHSGNFMIQNISEIGLKSHVKFPYFPAVTSGTLIQKLSLYIPSQSGHYLNQMEIRRAIAGENLHIRWTDTMTRYCWRLDTSILTSGKQFCKELPPLSQNTWHTYKITLQQMGKTSTKWRITINLDGQDLFKSNGNKIPDVIPLDNKFGFIFIGDECQNGEQQNCEGLGTFYYDDVEAIHLEN